MNKLEINLLPPELNISKQESVRKKLVIRTSIGFLVITILATTALFILVIAKSLELKNNSTNIDNLKDKISSLKEQESLANILRGRLNLISVLTQKDSPEVDAYNLITALMPPNISLTSLTLDKNKKMLISGESASSILLDNFFNNLTDPTVHEGKIASTSINSLSVSNGTRIKFDLTVSLKN